jgi:hypothetical protein
MKNSRLMWLMIACCLVMGESAYGIWLDSGPQQSSAVPSRGQSLTSEANQAQAKLDASTGETPDHGPAGHSNDKAHASNRDRPAKPNHVPRVPSPEAQSLHEGAEVGRQTLSGPLPPTASSGATSNHTPGRVLPTRPPSIVSRPATAAATARHRGSNPPVIGGGSGNSKARNYGSISGSAGPRRP